VVHHNSDQDDEQTTELNMVDVATRVLESHHNINQIPEPRTEDDTSLKQHPPMSQLMPY